MTSITGNLILDQLFLTFALPFVVVTAITFVAKGRDAFRWSAGVRKSARVNVALYITNTAFAVGIFIGGDWWQGFWNNLGLPHLPEGIWDGLPSIMVFALVLLAKDFADYWNHRLLHWGPVWHVHAVHHSDSDMNYTTSARVHFLEGLIMNASYAVLIAWLSLPPMIGGWAAVVLLTYNMYVHADIDWDHGPLAKVFASPRWHKWHHANEPSAYNKNFANVFPFYDVLFGTYHCPGPCNLPLGYEGSPNHDFVKLWVLPLTGWAADIRGLTGGLRRLQNRHEKGGRSGAESIVA